MLTVLKENFYKNFNYFKPLFIIMSIIVIIIPITIIIIINYAAYYQLYGLVKDNLYFFLLFV